MAKKLWACEKQALEAGYNAMSELNEAIHYLDYKASEATSVDGKEKGDACHHQHLFEEIKSQLSKALNELEYGKQSNKT